MKNKKSIQFFFSVCLYLTLMSFFGCEDGITTKKLLGVGNKAVSTLSFFVK